MVEKIEIKISGQERNTILYKANGKYFDNKIDAENHEYDLKANDIMKRMMRVEIDAEPFNFNIWNYISNDEELDAIWFNYGKDFDFIKGSIRVGEWVYFMWDDFKKTSLHNYSYLVETTIT